ncbi:MAG: neutral/alkaline non-lysosomal ceramidase N-terminal domain-containing protein [Verrucomicrobia bacterium]|nr:neutral/alkaline non-lysosomal ceramidase N-terminal domain-containing protein [Verrucomicrobiota bacterium]
MTAAETGAPVVQVGVAKIDITPELPIRLSGYQSRATEASAAEMRLQARALAIGSDAQRPAVLITVELIGVGEETTAAVAAALRTKHGLERARVAICATHIHTGPALADVLPFMFSRDLPEDEQARIARYTAVLREKLVTVAEAALADRRPARLAWSEGRTDFAAQRRVIVDGKWKSFGVTPGGPVDHALPVLRVSDEQGRVRAVFLSYACHCTTLEGKDNYLHGDWAGDAAVRVERAWPGAVALVALGCGADANPNPRGAPAVAGHGEKIAAEVQRLLAAPMRPLAAVSEARRRAFELDLDHAVTREELRTRAADPKRVTIAYAAKKFLAELDAGRALPQAVPYAVQTWAFGRELTMVFLAGEIVSEYSLRLRRELDGGRLWVNGYANSVPSYIASKRMFAEGGYEVDGSMDYYGWPTRLAIGTEDRIVQAVRELAPEAARGAGQAP